MKRIMSLVLAIVMIASIGVVGFAEEKSINKTELSAEIADKYGIVVKEDNEKVKVVTCPTEKGIVTIKYFKETGDFEIVDENGESKIIEKSAPGTYEKMLEEESLKSASHPDGSYQRTVVNYEYEANNYVAPWKLIRPNGWPNTKYFYSYEDSNSVNALNSFADKVDILDEVEKDFMLTLGSGAFDLLKAYAESAPAGHLVVMQSMAVAAGYLLFDVQFAVEDVCDAMSDCHDKYFYVFNNYAD